MGAGGAGGMGGTGGVDSDRAAAALFDMPFEQGIVRIDITLSAPSIDALALEPKTYVEGQVGVRVGEQVIDLPAVGVRLQGNLGFRTLAEKASFLLDFDHYVDGQALFGLQKLTLRNMVQDPSMLHENLGYALFRAMDAPASRSGYANVYVNGELYGLYAAVEAIDNPTLLDPWFGDHSGNLYEGEYGSDVKIGSLSTFEQDSGKDVGFQDLDALALELDGMTDPETFLTDVAKVIDIDRYLRFAAVELFLGQGDGYVWARNNFFIYRRTDDGRFTFMPWGFDQTFSDDLYPYGGIGRIQAMCVASMPCRKALAEAIQAVAARAQEIGLAARALALKEILWSDIVADPRKEETPADVEEGIAGVVDFLKWRQSFLDSYLGCFDPAFLDADQDGASGCAMDCNDGDPTIHPGAAEACNFIDDDCNGFVDDDAACPPCAFIPAPVGSGTLAVCFAQPAWKNWVDAEADCVAMGGHLASIHDAETQSFLVKTSRELFPGNWWIGLGDVTSEGQFVWTDGTPYDWSSWGKGEPNDSDGVEDCVHLMSPEWDHGGNWNDITCDNLFPYICRLP